MPPAKMARRIHVLVEYANNTNSRFVELIEHGVSAYDQPVQIRAIFRGCSEFGTFQ